MAQQNTTTLPLFDAMPEKNRQPSDSAARARALDPQTSFIVQAPAGSGKTELLTRRILALLATVDAPEEVLAITFTRKAASEMRTRVMSALGECESAEANRSSGSGRERFALARAALARSRELGWELEKNPSRLWISTIDAFNHYLAGKMPWLSRLGGPPTVSADAFELYAEAARRAFLHLCKDDLHAEAVERVLAHLGNNAGSFRWLVAALLAKRDQWLRRRRRIQDPDALRPELEAALAELVEAALAEAGERLLDHRHLLTGLAAYAGGNVADESPIALLREVEIAPGFDAAELGAWRGFAELFLTAKGEVRKNVNVRQGFPAGKNEPADWKARMKDALDALREDGEGCRALARVKGLPQPAYDNEQWEIIAPIIRVLDLAILYLWGVMSERRECDFNEVAERGLGALGAAQDPSELLLALDRRLRHILVDEFQDTSHLQFGLLERLTEGWEPGDGRTLFLVGDPMQSIYRFRESEVALFFKAAREGVGPVALESLSLTVNFRSDGAVIDWINEVFTEVFPASDDADTGAVRYSPCVAFHGNRGVAGGADEAGGVAGGVDDRTAPVRFVPLAGKEPLREAREVVDEAITRRIDGTVGILVRSRTHLKPIVSELARRGVSYRGEELDKLKDRAVVKDLRSLLDALFNPADRLAWLSVLRAPWCGLTLGELLLLVGDDKRPVAQILEEVLEVGEAAKAVEGGEEAQKSDRLSRLSAAAAASLKRVWPILDGARRRAGRLGLRELIEGAWCELGGPTYLDGGSGIGGQQLADAEALFCVLERLDEAGQPGAPQRLDRAIEGLYARPDPGGDQGLSVMTIHKAKGLEFDTVLLPGLGHRPPSDKGQLIEWAELPSGGLVIGAPPPTMVGSQSPVRDFIRELDKQKSVNERIRLLYVAATRARTRLVMWGAAKVDADGGDNGTGETKPATGSMLALLWFKVEGTFAGLAPSQEEEAPPLEPLSVKRLPPGWLLPQVVSPEVGPREVEAAEGEEDEKRQFDWAREERKLIGTLAHRLIERISVEGLKAWPPSRVESMRETLSRKLTAMGVGQGRLDEAVGDVVAAAKAVLEDERGRWIVGAHEDAHSEYELGGIIDGKVERRTIDRTFIDDKGVRWIVDYKVSSHSGDVEAFLEAEKSGYRPQLERYVRLFKLKEPSREIRAALYYPLFRRFVEVVC